MIGQADVISIELHRTKEDVDRILRSCGFVFRPTGRRRACKKFISNLLVRPRAALELVLLTAWMYPKIIYMRINETRQKNRLITGTYVKAEGRTITIQ